MSSGRIGRVSFLVTLQDEGNTSTRAFLTFTQPSSSAEKENTCLAPPQPDNGSWKLLNFESFTLSEVHEGILLPSKSSLKYECNPGYLIWGSSIATCQLDGNWENIPVCRACHRLMRYSASVGNGQIVNTTHVPWSAFLFLQKTTDKSDDHICGATIIKENLLLTAAHCIYDKVNLQTNNPNKYYVVAGQIYPDAATMHDKQYLTKYRVKNIYINSEYLGMEGNFTADIAILEIVTSFVFSTWLLPSCFDYSFTDSGEYFLPNNAIHIFEFPNDFNVLHQLYKYVPFSQCKLSYNSIEFERYQTMDKFCANYLDGKICKGVDGSGLMTKKNNWWYLIGIYFNHFDKIYGSCRTSYSLFTRISSYRGWIRATILQIEISKLLSSSFDTTVTRKTSETPVIYISNPQNTTTKSSSCITRPIVCAAPPQPANGIRQLHESQCQSQKDCDVHEGVELPAGSHLIYSCYHGYKINGSRDVFCSSNGKWINIPICIEIHCDSLVSASTSADCTYNGEWTFCESAVQPGTIAKISCRIGYKQDSTILLIKRDQVRCNDKGQWTPDPIKCIPVCGYVPTLYATPFIVNGINADFVPWHATLYVTKRLNGPKEFICGATIITENFLVTAAHCVFDETVRRVKDPNNYYVATGNKDRDYDHKQHDLRFVKKARVKNIYVHCKYFGILGNYAYDIALLEIDVPFVFTNMLIPACIDDTFIESGLGVVVGFGFTASGSSSPSLQLTKLPYVSDIQCKAINNSVIYEQYITSDKYCAGYTNGTSVCDGDSGGGFVSKVGGLWFLRGIVSIGTSARLEAGTVLCDTHSYSLYTRISYYLSWIRDIIYKIEPTELCIRH